MRRSLALAPRRPSQNYRQAAAASPASAFKILRNNRRQPAGDHCHASRIGMDAVRQKQRPFAQHPIQHERVKRGVIFVRQIRKDGVERSGIIGPHIGRREHAGQHNRDTARLGFAQDRVQIVARFLRRQPAQHVVAAKSDQHQVRLARQPVEREGQPGAPRRRRVARHAGIHHLRLEAAVGQRARHPRRQPLSLVQIIAGIETVAKRHDQFAVGRWRRPGRRLHPLRLFSRRGRGRRVRRTTRRQMDNQRQCPILRQPARQGPIPFMHSPLDPATIAIRAQDVTLQLGTREAPVTILKGIDLHVQRGQSVAVLGASGSGKSSLMAVLTGLERASGGRVEIGGVDFGALGEDDLARARRGRIGIILQSFHLLPTMTALENVAVPLELAGQADAFAIAAEELRAVGLGHRLDHYPAQLSGGEQQRVAIARAVAPRPTLLFADEPTGNLDTTTGATVVELLFGLNKEEGTTLVLVTHDNGLADRCQRKFAMTAGHLEEVS